MKFWFRRRWQMNFSEPSKSLATTVRQQPSQNSKLFCLMFSNHSTLQIVLHLLILPFSCFSGKCQSCSKQLRSVYATDDEFNELSNHFLDKILIGSSIFSKTTPQELESFLTFVDRTKPYDCVIDGLNVAHSKNSTNPLVQANSVDLISNGILKEFFFLNKIFFQLASVVKYFVDRKLTVCVLGRKHMTKWPKYQMNYIRENSHLFLTDNL